jgi:mannose-6-phosphate isomerase-like protein (cupin superfamily)
VIVRHSQVREVAEPENDLVLRRLVHAPEHGDDLSLTWVRLAGRHRRLQTDRSTRVYYVLEGEIVFEIGADAPVEAGRGDAVVIRPGTPYALRGKGAYLVVNGPAFRDGDDLYPAAAAG